MASTTNEMMGVSCKKSDYLKIGSPLKEYTKKVCFEWIDQYITLIYVKWDTRYQLNALKKY